MRTTITLFFFVPYVLFILIYGLVTTRKQKKDSATYLVAGHGVDFVHMMTHHLGTAFGGSDFFSTCALGFTLGIAGVHWHLAPLVAFFVLGKFLAPRVKAIAGNDVSSMSGLFSKVWNQNKFLELLVAIASFSVCWAFFCAQISAMGKMFNTLVGVDSHIGALIGAAIILVYVYVAGYGAVIKLDFVQSIVLLSGVVIFMGGAIYYISTTPEVDVITLDSHYWSILGGMTPWAVLNVWAGHGIGKLATPYVYQQVFAAKDSKTAKRGILHGNFIAFIGSAILLVVGIMLAKFIPADSLPDTEAIIPHFILKYLPPVLGGPILAAIFAAIFSSADSLLMSAINLWVDSIVPLWDKRVHTDDQHRLKVAKTWVPVWGILSVVLVFFLPSVISLVLRGASLMATLAPALFVTLFFRNKVDVKVVIASILAGFVVVFVFNAVPALNKIFEGGILPGFCVSSLVMLVGALIVKKKDPVVHIAALDEITAKKST